MLRKLINLKYKKGFTIVELMICIAIIAVLIAIIVPMSDSAAAHVKKASANAQSLYYFAQNQIMSINRATSGGLKFYKLSSAISDADPPYSGDIHISFVTATTGKLDKFCLTIGNDNLKTTVAPVAGRLSGGKNTYTFTRNGTSGKLEVDGTTFADTKQQDTQKILNKIANYFDSFMEFADGADDIGSYYAVFDSKMRVTAAYFSKLSIDSWTGTDNVMATAKFSKNGYLGGAMVGAYPLNMCDKDTLLKV